MVETFVGTFTSTLFPSFTSFVSPAKKLSHHGRRSGGVIVLVRNVLMRYVKQIEVDYDNVIILEVSKELLGTDANVFVVNTYLNPPNSPFYDTCDYDNGIAMLEQCLLSILEKNEDDSFILCGDLNARTGSKVPSYFDFASSCFEAVGGNFWLDNDTSNDLSSKRCSRDIQANEYGHNFLVLCSSFDLCILNGACDGDTDGQYTYISTAGNSVIDCFIISRSLASLPKAMQVLERTDSKHMPVVCSLRCQKQPNSSKEVDVTLCKLKWSGDKRALFEQNLNLPENLSETERARSLINVDVNEAVSVFIAALSKVASCLVKKQSGKKWFSNEWYDKECRDMRRTTRKALRKFSRSRLNSDRDCYCELRKQYKHLLLTKEKNTN